MSVVISKDKNSSPGSPPVSKLLWIRAESDLILAVYFSRRSGSAPIALLQSQEVSSPNKLDNCWQHLSKQVDSVRLISYLYNVLQKNHRSLLWGLQTRLGGWAGKNYFQIDNLLQDIWDKSLQYIQTCSINTKCCLIQLKGVAQAILFKIKTWQNIPKHPTLVLQTSDPRSHFSPQVLYFALR